jgi:hypothetical protein
VAIPTIRADTESTSFETHYHKGSVDGVSYSLSLGQVPADLSWGQHLLICLRIEADHGRGLTAMPKEDQKSARACDPVSHASR